PRNESAAPAPLIDSFPTDCGGLGTVPRAGEVTFVRDGRLYGVAPDGTSARCLARAPAGRRLDWGGSGDRAFLAVSDSKGRVIFEDRDHLLSAELADVAFGLSRPTGTSVLFGSSDGRRLFKLPSTGGPPEELSFLKRHDEAIYHPAGEHIAVVGENHDGDYGIFLATNLGTDPQLLVVGEDARRIYSLSFSPLGFLYYVAEHDDHFDVHGMSLQPTGTGDVTTSPLQTFYSSEEPIARVVVSQFRPVRRLAIEVGVDPDATCPSKTVVWTNQTKPDGETLPGESTKPVGWLPNGDLVYVTTDAECESTDDIFVWSGDRATLLAQGVSAPAIRGQLPPPPDPPTVLPEVVA
ncbi:MAG: hypothetical protein M3238_06200, partial [Actinomycetota bacterium]|nr:hypothetical protein [Actinomycetota bacterium]